jgi:hypothetical protein
MNALRTLLSGLIDYAGLFPPAELGMNEAVANYQSYRRGPEAWMLGRFIAPGARLGEFGRAVEQLEIADPWLVSAICGSPQDAARVREFNAARVPVRIDTIEVRANRPEEIASIARDWETDQTIYVEIPIQSDPQGLITALKGAGLRAKARTGGLTPEAFPTSSDLMRFLQRCAEADLPFKATAGLHHPLRSVHYLTYASDSPTGTMHGFLNVFLAAAALRSGINEREVAELLTETSIDAFRFDQGGVSWRGHRLTSEQLHRTREGFAIAFGSCSFEEPADDLKALKLL